MQIIPHYISLEMHLMQNVIRQIRVEYLYQTLRPKPQIQWKYNGDIASCCAVTSRAAFCLWATLSLGTPLHKTTWPSPQLLPTSLQMMQISGGRLHKRGDCLEYSICAGDAEEGNSLMWKEFWEVEGKLDAYSWIPLKPRFLPHLLRMIQVYILHPSKINYTALKSQKHYK